MRLVGPVARPVRSLARRARTVFPAAWRGPEERAEFPVDDVLEEWARELRTRPGRIQWFTRFARGTRSVGARDVLALSATQGAADLRRLSAAVEQARRHPDARSRQRRLDRLRRVLWKPGVLALARVLYSQRMTDRDLSTALALYEIADRIYGVHEAFEGVDRSLYSDLLTWAGRFSRADEVLDHEEEKPERACSQTFLRLNAVNPSLTGDRQQRAEWLARLNRLYAEHGLVGLDLPEGEAPSFHSLHASAEPVAEEGLPLVSVIMPIYEPDAATDVAIRSLLAQTWTNLEILIIDDASPAVDDDGTPTPYRDQLRRWEAADPRVRVIFCEENRGAYAVRNDAFDLARGEFVTVADKDDWHHPQKFERQARDLMERPDRAATIVTWVRADEDLTFLVRWGPDRVVHPSFASIMYRREEIRETLGYWDAVRKSADAEHRARYEVVYGEKLVPEDMVPMAISLMGAGNLTSSDFGLGYWHPDREIYQDAYSAWHEEIAAGASAVLPKQQDQRRWIAPPSFLPEREPDAVPHYDVVYLSEFGLWGGTSLALEQEIEAALDAGLRVGVLPLQNGLAREASKRRMTPALRRLVLTGRVDRLHLQRRATAALMVIHWPPILQLLPAGPSAIQVERLVAVADQLPATVSRVHRGYEVEDVSTHSLEIFGQRPCWAPQSSVVRRRLADLVPPAELLDVDWSSAAEPQPGPGERRIADGSVPVVGRPWDEEELTWPPSAAERAALFPQDGSAEVVLRADRRTLVRRGILESAETLPPGWRVDDHAAGSFREHLAELDYLLCFSSEIWDESIEPSILEALAAGVVCVGPPVLQEVYGDAVVGCEPRDVPPVLSRFADRAQYEAQRRRGLAFLERARSRTDYARRMEALGAAPLRGRGSVGA